MKCNGDKENQSISQDLENDTVTKALFSYLRSLLQSYSSLLSSDDRPTHAVKKTVCCHSVMPGSLRPHGLQPSGSNPSMGFPRQEYWSGLPVPSPGDLPDPGIEPAALALSGGFFTTEPPGKPTLAIIELQIRITKIYTPIGMTKKTDHTKC